MRVLGIESSCDETGVAVYDSELGLVAEAVHSQIDLHAVYGGVVPELASRDHVRRLVPLIQSTLEQANLSLTMLDGVAYTAGPGLVGALLVGAALAQSLAWSLGVPAVEVHHMEGHLLAPVLDCAENVPKPPYLALLVSGGHTMLVRVEAMGCYTILGQSMDDAVGEAFDKTAKIMGLGYPGGPALAKLAARGAADDYVFPRPMTNRPGLDFSFSGLKTHVRNTYQQSDQSDQAKANIARAFEDAVVDTLLIKCRRAAEQTGLNQLVLAGGVSANQRLRQALSDFSRKSGVRVFYPPPHLCTDNGAMIAYAGYLRLEAGQRSDLAIRARPRWPMEGLAAIQI